MDPSAAARFDELCEILQSILASDTRREVIDRLGREKGDPAAELRRVIRGCRMRTSAGVVAFQPLVEAIDAATTRDGFHVLHTWDPVAHRFRGDPTPALLLEYLRPFGGPGVRRGQALLLDTWFLFLLMLLVMRVWDTEDPDAAVDRLGILLGALQGPGGSGRRLAGDPAMLIGLAIAQYQPDERGYDALLARIRTLNPRHQEAIALSNAANFGAHLRWGSRYMYDQDVERMRRDNVVDYPWVLHAVATLAQAWGEDGAARVRIDEGLLQCLSADPAAFLSNDVPDVLAAQAGERSRAREILLGDARELAALFGETRPESAQFSPLAFHFNFLHNVLTATLALTIDEGTPNLPLDALLYSGPSGTRLADSPDVLAHQLALYAADPERRGARKAPLIVHDAAWGQSCVDGVLAALEGG